MLSHMLCPPKSSLRAENKTKQSHFHVHKGQPENFQMNLKLLDEILYVCVCVKNPKIIYSFVEFFYIRFKSHKSCSLLKEQCATDLT